MVALDGSGIVNNIIIISNLNKILTLATMLGMFKVFIKMYVLEEAIC